MATWDDIPKENRKDITEVFLHVQASLPCPPIAHLKWLFEVYNKFISPSSCKKITCRTDRVAVLNVISTYVKIWKQQEESLSK